MKYLPFIATAFVIVAVMLSGDWAIRAHFADKPHAQSVSPPTPMTPAQAYASAHPQYAQWHEFHQAREKVLHDDPQLAAEYQQLRSDIQKQEDDVNAAMIKLDPKVAPILAKLVLLRHPAGSGNTPATIPPQ